MEQPNDNQPTSDTSEVINPTLSEKRRAAGQRNGRLGAGKKTPEGLAASAQNGLKHGFFSRQFCLLSTESPAFFEKFRDAILAELQPITPQQYRIAQSITQSSWLLERNFAMEVTAMDIEISSHKKNQAGTGERVSNQMTAWLAFDSLVQKNSSLSLLYRQRTQLERQLTRLRKEYAETIALRESVAYTSYIPPLPEPDNPMFQGEEESAAKVEAAEETEIENCKNEGNGPEPTPKPDTQIEFCKNEGNDFTPRE